MAATIVLDNAEAGEILTLLLLTPGTDAAPVNGAGTAMSAGATRTYRYSASIDPTALSIADGTILAARIVDAGGDLYALGWVTVTNGQTCLIRDARYEEEILTDTSTTLVELINAIEGAGVTGDRSFTILVTDQDDVPLEGAKVTTRLNADKPAFYTDADGSKDIQRDDGTWSVSIQLWGYDFDATTLVVNAAIEGTTVTYQMTRRVSTSEVPGAVSATFVWTTLGVIQAGETLYYKMTKVPTGSTGNVFGDGETQSVLSDDDGIVTLNVLYPGATYIFWTASSSRTPVKITIAANATDPVDLASLLSS